MVQTRRGRSQRSSHFHTSSLARSIAYNSNQSHLGGPSLRDRPPQIATSPARPPSPLSTLRLSQTSPRLRFGAFLALTLCLVRPAHAQDDRVGRLEGRVIDSTRARPLVGARVVAFGVDAS